MSGSNKISNKPIVWGLFAGGGTLTAFITPVLVLVTLLVALGAIPAGLSYETMHGFAVHWIGKIILFGVIFLSLWHAAHRFRITIHDFGIRADTLVAALAYLLAGIGTVLVILYLLRV
uniref:Succinate dehydrogenase subunit D n=1 Tax=Candidatus Kentrum sp. FW TaxID=2126338 RepID=A0A450RSW9_9GAMM|nr:MAG: succinate dehydrogenase subunit D [Candidatus Kentron sp. FW]VFJ50030.1 MAG: succinate dehydrogenase subunit D [Candidatus Kentron sp. FW]